MITVGSKQVGVDPGRIPMDQAGFQPCQAAGMQALHARMLECRPICMPRRWCMPRRCAWVECLAGMQPGGQEQHTCMHDWSIQADLDLKLDAGCILQPIS